MSFLYFSEIGVNLLRSIQFLSVSPPTCLKHVSFEFVGYHDADHTIGVILSLCTALETITVTHGKYFQYFRLHDVSSPVLRQVTISNCIDLHSISIACNQSLQKLQKLNFSGNSKLAAISLDTETSPLPSLETLDVSNSSVLYVDSLALFCSQLTSLKKVTATNLPKNALGAALDEYPALKLLQVEGKLMADMIWQAKHVAFNKGGIPGDPGMYGRSRGTGAF
jgi:Leucine-rich repeat (LRR) protein